MHTQLPGSDDPRMRQADAALRACVHCGMCNAACPTYDLAGSELDGPRGRIYLIKNLLEGEEGAASVTLRHLDNCLTCLACVNVCPAGVDYAHLVEYGREVAEEGAPRGWAARAGRRMLAAVLTRPGLFAWVLAAGRLARPLRGWVPGRLREMLESVPPSRPVALPGEASPAAAAGGEVEVRNPRRRVMLLDGCVQQSIAPNINAAATRELARREVAVAPCPQVACCGALEWHLGLQEKARARARENMRVWLRAADEEGVSALVMTASGCGAAVRSYPSWFADAPEARADAERLAEMVCDVGAYLHELGEEGETPAASLASGAVSGMKVAWHAPCSLANGEYSRDYGPALLEAAGFSVARPRSSACCGSAGAYHLLRPETARELGRRKAADLQGTGAAMVATANVGCLAQIQGRVGMPVRHVVEVLDWARGARGA